MSPSPVTPLAPVAALALDDALELKPNASVIAIIGGDDLAEVVVAQFPAAVVRAFNDVTPQDEPAVGFTRAPLDGTLFENADLVVGLLPKSLAELTEIASLAATAAAPGVVMTLAGRDKHMSRGMNAALESWFRSVSASRGRQKSRALRAREPHPVAPLPYPRRATVAGLPFAVYAHGGAFAGATLDIGTRALLDCWQAIIAAHDGAAQRVVDLGCGTGVLATTAALRLPAARVTATDRSWAAVASTTLTAADAGVGDRVTVTQDDAGAAIADGTVDLVLFNPPFHDGAAVDEDMSHRMFRAAARMLRPGGSLAVVYNSHLRHRGALERIVGPTEQLDRTPKFTVTLSRRR